MDFDPKAIITITEYEAMSPRERDAYDRAHMLHAIAESDGGKQVIAEYDLETADLDFVSAAFSNAIQLGAASPRIARTWLIGGYHERDAEVNPGDWPGGPPPVG